MLIMCTVAALIHHRKQHMPRAGAHIRYLYRNVKMYQYIHGFIFCIFLSTTYLDIIYAKTRMERIMASILPSPSPLLNNSRETALLTR